MITYYKTIENKMTEIDDIQNGCWISMINPTEDEISKLEDELSIDRDFIRAALDEEEPSRIECQDDQTLIVVDYPIAETDDDENKTLLYSTMPMSIILTEKNVITVCLKENSVLNEIAKGVVKGIQTNLKTRFVFFVLLRIATRYLQYLKQIDKISNYVENKLHKSMQNKELIQLLGLEKSLVYFSTSLKSNENVLEKILRGRVIKLYDEDQDLLEDVLIEIKQAIEMSNIYSNILSGTMDAFASVISNNLNIVMKKLTVYTIIMAVPTMIFSFYGMNIGEAQSMLPFAGTIWVPLGISIVLAVVAAIVLKINGNKFK